MKESRYTDEISRDLAALSSEQLTRVLQDLNKRKKRSLLETIQARERASSILPMSFAQQRLWFLNQLEPNSSFYNTSHALRLTGPLHIHVLQQSLEELVRRHEALRTTFATIDGLFVQIVNLPKAPLPVIDLCALSPADRHSETIRLTNLHARFPFHLSKDILIRFSLLQVDKQEYVLLLTMHHIICDAWSMDIFTKELEVLYNTLLQDLPSPLLPLPIQYADYALWQQEWLQGTVLENLLAYWKQQLQDLPTLQLPTDFARPAIQRYQGLHYDFALPASLCQALRQLSLQEGVTLFMLLLTAFQALLARYSGQEDVAIGTPIANRTHVEFEGLIGFFANTLVMRTDLSGNPTFRTLLKRVRDVCLGAYTHQDMPFEKLVEILQPERDMSRTPLFQVLFAFQKASQPALHLTGLVAEWLPIESQTAKFDLSLFVQEADDGLLCALEYNTDLFEKDTISRLADHWKKLLESIVAQPDMPVHALLLLTRAEQDQLLTTWNATQQDWPGVGLLHEIFAIQAARTPDAIAVVCGEQHLTYEELDRRAAQLADYLYTQGVRLETRVGLCMERSIEVIVGLLGILKAGGVYVPLDPMYPENRLTFMLMDADVHLILSQAHVRACLPAGVEQVLCLDTQWSVIAQTRQFPMAGGSRDNLAYVVYTSGSTGRPKGIAMTHRAITNLIAWGLQNTCLPSPARTIQFASPSFDVSLQEMFLTLGSGGTLVLISQVVRRNIEEVAGLIIHEAIERLYIPAIALQQLARVFEHKGIAPAHLREIIAGSEQLQITDSLCWLSRSLGGCVLRNEYGPSESHVATAFTLPHAPEEWAAAPPIGRPVANTEIYILDSYLYPTPVGVPGELYISGAGLARGYLAQPDLTAERFTPNPYSQRRGARLYKTGDLARYLPDGNIEFLGRIDYQVKLRGYRIELAEIETILTEHPDINETAVLLHGDSAEDKQLVAYLAIASEREITPTMLRTWLRERVPDYMVPSSFVFLERFPLTAHGKVDRSALATFDRRQMEEASPTYIAPRDEIEYQLVQIWEELLPSRPIGVTADFFELGGHSLLAVRLMAQIRSRFGLDLPLSTLFQDATIEHLARRLRRPTNVLQRTPLVPIRPSGSKPPFFCVHPVGGEVLCYSPLARLLDTDQPFYGLQYTEIDTSPGQVRSIELLATQYITALRSLQPQGPYLLGGWSMGGLIAFEMAQQLQKQGEAIALLLLIDSYAPTSDPEELQRDLQESALRRQFVEDLVGLPSIPALFSADNFSQSDDEWFFMTLYQNLKQMGFLQAEQEYASLQKLFHIFKANKQALCLYQPQLYTGPLTILQASEHEGNAASQTWMSVASGALIDEVVPGTHYTLLKQPSVATLARRVQYYLDRAENFAFFSGNA